MTTTETKRVERAVLEAAKRRVRRVALDKTLEEIAALVGVDASQIHRWERGKASPRDEQIEAWERVLQTLEAK